MAGSKAVTSKTLKVGEAAGSDVHLKMDGGYTDAHLVPGEAEPGTLGGVLLVQEGDVVTAGMVQRLAIAEENAKNLAEGDGGSKRSRRRSSPASTPASGVGVPTAGEAGDGDGDDTGDDGDDASGS